MAQPTEQLLAGDFPSFRHLRVFEAVARLENVGKAAVDTNMSQPAVTQAVMRIESWVGAKLFERSWTGTFLTREGKIFLLRVRRLFEQVEAALMDDLYRDAPKDKVQTVMNRLKRSHINVLAAVAAQASFEGAAPSLDLSRTTVHRTARELERIIGRSLYQRSSSGLVVNAAARRLAMALLRACRELPEGVEEIAILVGRMKSRLFIGAQRLLCSSMMASAVNAVLRLYPDTQVKIIEGSYRQLLHELRSGRIDYLFGTLECPAGVDDVVEEELLDDPYCVACRRDHPLLVRQQISLADLAELGWVLPGTDSQRSRAYEQLFRAADHRPASCLMISGLTTQISILSSSDRVTLLPRMELAMEPLLGGLTELPFPRRIDRISDGLTVRADWTANSVQAFFHAQLREGVRSLATSRQGSSLRPRHEGLAPQAV